MPSYKVTMILLAKTDLLKEHIDRLDEKEAWNIVYSLTEKKKKTGLEICFTGFSKTEKENLELHAKDNGFQVVGSVTKKLDFLCCGENAGPKKRESAESQGVQLIDKAQFENLIETGEIPQ